MGRCPAEMHPLAPVQECPDESPTVAGILNVADHVADDSCLYFESYVFRTVNESSVANAVKAAAIAGLSYYIGLNSSATPQQIADQVRPQTLLVT